MKLNPKDGLLMHMILTVDKELDHWNSSSIHPFPRHLMNAYTMLSTLLKTVERKKRKEDMFLPYKPGGYSSRVMKLITQTGTLLTVRGTVLFIMLVHYAKTRTAPTKWGIWLSYI